MPAELVFAFKHGKRAYLEHPGFQEATEEAFSVYLACGVLIHYPEKAKALWRLHREALLKKPDIKEWWGYQEYEPKRI